MFVLFKRPHLPLSKHKPTRSHFHKELRHPSAARPCLPQLIEMSANPDRVRSFPKTHWILEGNLISVLQQRSSLLSSRLTEAVALQALFWCSQQPQALTAIGPVKIFGIPENKPFRERECREEEESESEGVKESIKTQLTWYTKKKKLVTSVKSLWNNVSYWQVILSISATTILRVNQYVNLSLSWTESVSKKHSFCIRMVQK